MKVKAYVPSVPAESELNLALEQDEYKVSLIIVDSTGNKVCSPYILTITSDGQIYRFTGVNPTVGLQLDSYGRVMVDGGEY